VAPPTKNSGLAAKQRADRIADMINLRIQHWSLQEIANKYGITRARVHQIICKAFDDTVREPAEKLREIEAARLDRLGKTLEPAVLAGDPAAITPYLAIMARRARLLGLDRQTGGGFNHPLTIEGTLAAGATAVEDGAYTDEHGVQVVRVEIIGNPEITRRHPPPPESDVGDAPLPSTDDL
jgi:hypothetical protein